MSAVARGVVIKRERNRARLTQMELANATGVGLRTVGRAERGDPVSDRALEVLEYFLGLSDAAPDVPAPPPVRSAARDLAAYTTTELLAEVMRRTAHLDA